MLLRVARGATASAYRIQLRSPSLFRQYYIAHRSSRNTSLGPSKRRHNYIQLGSYRTSVLSRANIAAIQTEMKAIDSCSGLPVGCGLSLSLWNDCKSEAYESLHSSFVRALAQGALERSTFQHYVEQDAYFLEAFAQAYALALTKGSRLPKQHFEALAKLLNGVHEELELHNSYAVQWGVDLCRNPTPNRATTAYTDFLLSVALNREYSVAHVLAAMLPCSRLYGYIGCQLAAAYPGAHHDYSEWITTYSSPAYLALPALKEQMMDELGQGQPYGELLQLYRRAMQLEVDFFCAQTGTPPPPAIGVLVTDFDDTITEGDTIGTLFAAAAETAGQVGGEEARRQVEQKTAWLAANYAERYTELMARLLPGSSTEPPEPPAAAYDAEGLSSFLARLSEFDVEMNGVVVDSGVLAGLGPSSLREAAGKVALRPGCRKALQRMMHGGLYLGLLSVNWSADFVSACLDLPASIDSGDTAASNDDLPGIRIIANQLEMDGDGPGSPKSTGRVLTRVQCADHKRREFEQLLASWGARQGPSAAPHANGGQGNGISNGSAAAAPSEQPLSVYVGDSVSDLPPLLMADYGLVIGRSSSLRRVCRQYGVRLAPLCAAPLVPTSKGSGAGTLYEAADWDEVAAFVMGPASRPLPAWRQQQPPADKARAVAVPRVPRVLIVAGSDSGGGAGLQADLKTCTARGVFGMTAVTALTAQNTHGVHGVHATPLDFLTQQMDCVLSDLGADVVKTGMLPSAEAVAAVAAAVQRHRVPWLVVDPVMVSTSGHSLAGGGVVAAMKEHLLPIAGVVTPNLPEASALLGGMAIHTLEDMQEAARRLHQLGPRYVLIKGGHLLSAAQAADGSSAGTEDRQQCRQGVDVLYDGRSMVLLREDAVDTANTHGTGCTLASAIAAELAKGVEPITAAHRAKKYLTAALRHSRDLRLGTGRQTPFNHGFEIADWAAPPAAAPGRPALDLRVYAVTDPHCNAKLKRSMVEAVKLALEGGATIVQLREKDMDGGDFLEETLQVMQVARRFGVPVIINDRVDVAMAADADGVHVGQSDLPAATVRRLLGPSKILGVSVKTAAEAIQAQADGADYLGTGAVYPTGTKDSSVIGLQGVSEVCSAVRIPVVAIGGLTIDNAAATVTAGAAGVAVVSAIFAAQDAAAATREIQRLVDDALSARPGATQ